MPYMPRQYMSAEKFLTTQSAINIVNSDDQARIKSYEFYDDAYHNRPQTFKVVLRGDDESSEIYIPSAKRIVDATARFLAVNFNFVVDPDNAVTDQNTYDAVNSAFKNLFKRENLYSKFITQKKYGLSRGDHLWHVTADDTKPQGSRISINTLYPGSWFPIEDPLEPKRTIGVHIVDLVQDPREKDAKKSVARRQTYKKTQDSKGNWTTPIKSSLSLWEVGAWDDRNLAADELKLVQWLKPEFNLPPSITAIPIYHFANNTPEGSTYGMSQLSGIETIINGINQSITDEDLTLVMQGLGVYVSSAGPPVNTDGTPGEYRLGPRDVVEINEGQDFRRVTGVSSISPYQDHMKFMLEQAQTAIGIPDMATGTIDVAVAQSGIALALKMGPILAENADKEMNILSTWDQFLYDLANGWFPQYEKVPSKGVSVVSVVDDAMPVNREAVVQELMLLFTSGVITIEMVQEELSKLGYKFSAGDAQKALDQAAIVSGSMPTGQVQTDQYGNPLPTAPDGTALTNLGV
jgi:hypothetical protein